MGLMDESKYKVLRTKTESAFAIRSSGAILLDVWRADIHQYKTAQAALDSTRNLSEDSGLDVVEAERQRPAPMTVGDLLAFLSTVDHALPVRTFREGVGEYGSDEDEPALSVGIENHEGGYLCISSQDHGAVDETWKATSVAISEPEVTELRRDFVENRRAHRQTEKAKILAKLAQELGVKIMP